MALDPQRDLIEHIAELRLRLLRSLIAVLVGFGLALFFTEPVLLYLLGTAQQVQIIAVSPLTPTVIFFKVAFILGLILAFPYIAYQLYAFMAPGLLPHEKRLLYFSLPGSALLFALGVAFALWVLTPVSLTFLRGFLPALVAPTYTLDEYISFVTTLMLWMGILFQLPLVIAALTRFGLVQVAQWRRWRKGGILGAAVLAAVITPTVDPFTMTVVTVPFLLLYEIGLIIARLVTPRRKTNEG